MEIRPSAHRHGKTVADIDHAMNHHIASSDISTGQEFAPNGILFIGPDLTGNLIEVIAVDEPDGSEVVIHAMTLRPSYARRLLRGGS